MEIGFIITIYLSLLLKFLLFPLYYLKALGNQKKVPPIKNNLLLISATKLAEKIRNKEIRSEEIVKVYIERIKEVNPIINAVVENRFQAAIEDAIAVDVYIQSNIINIHELKIIKPLLGVPLTVKESCSLKGCSLCIGSILRQGIRATQDGEAVSLLRNAGAIPLLVSNTPELCMCWETNNLITGRTNNPYNTSRTTAGSSGGEGALLGSAGSLIGVGSDVAGSIRLPAFYNGVFGHKPTARIVSFKGHVPNTSSEAMKSIAVCGPMTRYAEDLPLMLNVMAGENASKLALYEEVDLKQVNLFFMEDANTFATAVDKGIKEVMRKSIKYLEDNCKVTINNQKFKMENCNEMTSSITFAMTDLPDILEKNGKHADNLAIELLKSMCCSSKYSRNGLLFALIKFSNGFVMPGKSAYYQKELENLKKALLEALKDNGIFIYPTYHTAAFYHDSFLFQMNGLCYVSIFNLLGFPCTHVPLGLNKKGLPIGIQVVAAPYQDRLCLAVANELERAFGGWVPPS